MAYDLILKPNKMNLTQVSGAHKNREAEALALNEDLSRSLNAFDKKLSLWYASNQNNPGAIKLSKDYAAWRAGVAGYLNAYKPELAPRFIEETPPKKQQLGAFYKRFLILMGLAPGEAMPSLSTTTPPPPPTPTPPDPSARATPGIRTARNKAKTPSRGTRIAVKPVPGSDSLVPGLVPGPNPTSESSPASKALIVAGGLAALGGAFFLVKSQQARG